MNIKTVVQFTLVFLLLATVVKGENMKQTQGEIIPFDLDKWEIVGSAEFGSYLGRSAAHLGIKVEGQQLSFGAAILKEMNFENGIIEYDIAFVDRQNYPGINFRQQGPGDFERFYMRPHESGKPDANSYIPVFNGVQSWQLYNGKSFSSDKEYVFGQWQHIKLVVNDSLADIYIGDMDEPELTVELKHSNKSGTISLYGLNVAGDVWFSHFAVKHEAHPEIKGRIKPETVARQGTVMSWAISESFTEEELSGKTVLGVEASHLKYSVLRSDPTGIANLAKVQSVDKNTAFAKIVVKSEFEQTKKLTFGFANKVKVYLNDNLIFEGDDNFQSRDELFLGTMGFYDSVYLRLEQGNNEVLLAVTENIFFKGGWGVQARFEDMENISLIEE